MTETWTSLRLIQWTSDYFGKKGIPNPRLDSELLLAHVLKVQRIDLYTQFEKMVGPKDLAKFRELIERRAKREPLQYILGETEFWGLKIKVMPGVLIPRPETELLVEEAILCLQAGGEGLTDASRSPVSRKPSKDKRDESGDSGGAAFERSRLSVAARPSPPACILDIGTGSGCIAIALAKNLPKARVTATDIVKEALVVARENTEAHRVADRIELLLSDIAPWRSFQAAGRTFDLIVSNPPYIATKELAFLQPEVRNFEPHRALDGGPDGLTFLQKILEECPDFLKPGGTLLMEIGENQADFLKSEWNRFSGLKLKEFRRDYSGTERILRAKKK